jgi:hypothetical protein
MPEKNGPRRLPQWPPTMPAQRTHAGFGFHRLLCYIHEVAASSSLPDRAKIFPQRGQKKLGLDA